MRFTSRKFLLSVAAALYAFSQGQHIAAAVSVGIYVLVEGFIDARSASKTIVEFERDGRVEGVSFEGTISDEII